MDVLLWIGFIYLLITIVAIPFQYRYIISLEEMKRRNRKTQGQAYDSMSFEEQILHSNAQGNSLLILANILVHWLYKMKHRDPRQ